MPLGVGHLHQDLTWRHGGPWLQLGGLVPSPSSHQKGLPKLGLGTKVQGFPTQLWDSGSTCPNLENSCREG